MVLCELQLPEGTLQKLILRQPNANMLAQRPQTARDEFLLLQHLKSLQVGAPVPVAWMILEVFFRPGPADRIY